ncbi:MAG: alpha-amylase family glycosyl hydrolase [Ilumatobacteraceae bacterium]
MSGTWERGWWHDAVVYQVYPRSFADADGDGVGDLRGLRARLDHVVDLGVDAIWLSPIFRSPMADMGYDVSDYLHVDPVFGTDADLDDLIDACHQRGLRLLLDWVPNHTSDQHAWFVDSRSSRDSPRRDWYVWRDPAPDGSAPNDWTAAIRPVPAWTFDEPTGQYYLHLFLPEQPDLNWANPGVEAAMHDTLRHWLDRGVDGFRADVVHLIGKGADLPELSPQQARHPLVEIDPPYAHELLRRIRALLERYHHRPMMVGEVYLLGDGQTARYLGDDDELHLTFDFRALHSPWEPAAIRTVIERAQHEFAPPRWPTWVLANHDKPRVRTLCGSPEQARAAAVMSLTMRGTPFLYAGDELGLADAEVPADRVLDPAGRDGCRAPIPWTADPDHGWGPDPWLPFPPDASVLAAEVQRDDPSSMLHLYRRLLRLRRATPALRAGTFEFVVGGGPADVIAYRRELDGTRYDVAVNFAAAPRDVALAGPIAVSSAPGRDGASFDGTLGPHEAVVVRTG